MTEKTREALLEEIAQAAEDVVTHLVNVPLDDPYWERLEDLLTEWSVMNPETDPTLREIFGG